MFPYAVTRYGVAMGTNPVCQLEDQLLYFYFAVLTVSFRLDQIICIASKVVTPVTYKVTEVNDAAINHSIFARDRESGSTNEM